MTKNELIQYLRAYVRAEEHYEQLNEEKSSVQRKIYSLSKKPAKPDSRFDFFEWLCNILTFITTTVLADIIFTIIFSILLMLIMNFTPAKFWDSFGVTRYMEAHPIIFSFGIGIIICGIFVDDCDISGKKAAKIRYEKALIKYNQELPQLPQWNKRLHEVSIKVSQAEQELKALENKNIIHTSYLYDAKTLLGYFEKGRVDTLKEAVNLLEYEKEKTREYCAQIDRDYKMHKKLDNIAASQEAALSDIHDETARAADAAQDAAVWSAIGTILTASEIERQKKKDRE